MPSLPQIGRRNSRRPRKGSGLVMAVLAVCMTSGIAADEGPWPQAAEATAPSFADYADEALTSGPEGGAAPWSSNPKPAPHATRWQPFHDERLKIRGRIDTDLIGATQSQANRATFGDLDNVVGLRRARIGVEGHLTPESHYVAEIDLATGEIVIRDLFAAVGQPQKTGELKVGHFREPFSLEGGTSANSFAFMERSSINLLDPARNWGVGYSLCTPDEDATLIMGVFAAGSDSNDFERGPGSDVAVTGRWTWLPLWDDDSHSLMHVGVALSSRLPDPEVVKISQGPSSPLLDFGDSSTSPFVSTLRIPAEFEQLFNLQWAYQEGPAWVQAEWYGSWIDQRGGPPVFLHGGYVSTGWFLTGEHRSYLRHSGVFDGVTVNRPLLRSFSNGKEERRKGYGAWEVTARAAYLDFSDPGLPPGPLGQTTGGRLPQATVGLNWYLADRFRVMFNYTYSVPDEPNSGESTGNVFASRLGMFW